MVYGRASSGSTTDIISDADAQDDETGICFDEAAQIIVNGKSIHRYAAENELKN